MPGLFRSLCDRVNTNDQLTKVRLLQSEAVIIILTN
jgi:hypothetical protein